MVGEIIHNSHDDPMAKRCGHNFEASECPYRYCGYKALLQIVGGEALNPHDKLQSENERLRSALKHAKSVIRTWHDMGAKGQEHPWFIYQLSPEMKKINAALSEGGE